MGIACAITFLPVVKYLYPGNMEKQIEVMTRQAEFFGKPSRHTFDYIIKTTGVKLEEIAIVGDRLYTYIAVEPKNLRAELDNLTDGRGADVVFNTTAIPAVAFNRQENF